MRKIDWSKVLETQEFSRPTPGGYIARIHSVQDVEHKEYLLIDWDFAEGPFQGANQDTWQRKNFWPYSLRRSYKESALGFFKAFKTHLEESNPGYFFDEGNLQAMRGKYIGIILGEEEYRANDGSIKTRLSVVNTRSVRDIQELNYRIPELKKLKPSAPSGGFSDGFASEPKTFAPAGFTDLSADDGEFPF